MKYLVVITSKYPHENHEQFLHNEMLSEYTNDYFVTFIPTEKTSEDFTLPGTNNFQVMNIRKKGIISKISISLKSLCFLFTPLFYKEMLYIMKKPKRLYNTNQLIKFTVKSEYIFSGLKPFIKKLIRSESLVYSYWLYNQAYIAARIKKTFNIDFISRAHGFDLYEYRNKGMYIPYRKFILDNASKIFPVSNDGKGYLLSNYPVSEKKIIVNMLGTKDYGLVNKERNSYINIVTCSWLVPIKRINLLISSLYNVKNSEVVWTHFGDGYLEEELKLQSSFLPKNIHVSFKGKTNNLEILNYYRKNYVDFFINVSETEGIPISIMEAMSFGIPIIATNVGGVSEILIDGENGFLLEKDFDINYLSSLITESTTREAKNVNQMRLNSREIWENKCNIDRNCRRFYEEIDKLFENQK
jgi:colanic acid/amylovoran biosynthesis glycosyltransferase